MKELANQLGQRIRSYRTQIGLSQEELAERAGCHSSYIGQLERGEKNATVENIAKVAKALGISLAKLFANMETDRETESDIPLVCYEWLIGKPKAEQEVLYRALMEIEKYKKM